MPSSRKCIFGCKGDGPLFTPPKDDTVRQKWLDFIFGNDLPSNFKNIHVCARHFTEDCFLNKSLFDCGQISRLSLKEGAVLTIKSEQPAPSPPPSAPAPKIKSFAYSTRTVSTQLAAGTLRLQHYRSRGVQAAVSTVSRCTDTGKDISADGVRPPKRPRLEVEEEEDDDLSFSISQDSTYKTEDAVTDLSDLIDMESPCDFEDAKYIVFESSLRELFENCPVCQRHCIVHQHKCGTFVAFSQDCPHCSFSRKWQSQPMKNKIPQGNLELSAAVYFNGGSFTNFEKICNTMNLKVHRYDSFRRHAQNFLEPAIYHKWKADQDKVLEDMKRKGKIVISGDMRADSPGRSAKFGSYSVMELENKKILDIQLVQSNEVCSSVNLEKEGLRRSLDLLESHSVQVDNIVTDRHPEVLEYLQEREISHCYDVSHVVKDISKKLEALARKKDCRLIKKWLPSIKKHMSWAAYSSTSGSERVAKWTSLIHHIQNAQHEDLLFPKCVHPISASTNGNKWLKPGTVALNKLEKMLLNKRILEDVSKLSSNQQTSLELFHKLILQFAPKNVNFLFTEMLCRLYLAAMHHNEKNTKPEEATSRGKPLWKLRFAKSTKGQATARLIKPDATFGYRSDLMQLVLSEVLDNPTKFQQELQKVPVPPPLTSQCDVPLEEDIVAFQISDFYPVEAGSQHRSFLDLGTPAETTEPHITG